MKEIIKNLDKMIVHVVRNHLYALNKHHTLMLKLTLDKEYPEMSFQTKKWKNDSEYFSMQGSNILLKKDNEITMIPTKEADLKKEYYSMLGDIKGFVFYIEENIYKAINKNSGVSLPVNHRVI